MTPAEITDVVLTHGHPDHIGGVLDASGKPAFPHAQYTMSKTEWDFWTDPSVLHDVAMDEHLKQAERTRKRLLDRANADASPAFAYHFPFPGLGRVKSHGSAFRWEAAV